MVFTTSAEGYIESYSISDNVYFDNVENIIVDIVPPEDFFENSMAYKYINGEFILDKKRLSDLRKDFQLEQLRRQREEECFPIINRGQLWYNGLTETQFQELSNWYQDWLDVTETLNIPICPFWLK